MFLCISVTCVFLIALNGSFGQKTLNVGGLFYENDEQDLAFKYVIDSINSDSEVQLTAVTEIETPLDPYSTIVSACSLLEQGVVAIVGPLHHASNKDALHSLCDNKEIPFLETGFNIKPPRSASVVNFYPHPKLLSLAYCDIVRAFGWTTFTIIYEDNQSLLNMNQLIKMMDTKDIKPVMLLRLDAINEGNYRVVLQKARDSGQTNFVIDCSLDVLETVLVQLQHVGMITNKYNYFITNPDWHVLDLQSYMYSETNITGIRFIDPQKEAVLKASEELSEHSNSSVFADGLIKFESALLIDSMRMFHQALTGLESVESKTIECQSADYMEHGHTLVNMIKTSEFSGLTGVIKFNQEGFRTDFAFETIELTEEGPLKTGEWNSTIGFQILRPLETVDVVEVESLQNKTFVVITALTDPYGMLRESEKQLYGNEQYEGFGIDLIMEMANLEGFNYTFIIQEDKSNGARNEKTGKWSGMIGKVMDGVADLAITDLTITSDRAEAVDFTTPFMTLGISILYQKAKKAPPSFFSFAAPFGLEVWLSLSAAYFIVSVSLYLLGRICPDEWQNPYPCIEEPEFLINQFSLRNSFWFTIGSLLQQGTEIAPIAISTRMIAGMWWFFTLIMVSSYTANLAAFLTTENPDAHFTNVNELVERAEEMNIRYGAKANGATANFFVNSNVTIYQQIGKYMTEHPEVMVNDNNLGVKLANEGYYAFFMESTTIEYVTERNCNLTQVGGLLDEKGYGIAMRKNSPYGTALNTAILKLQASGKITELKRRWWQERHGGGQCAGEDSEESAVALNLKSVEGVFYVTAGGVLLSVIFVFVEMVVHNFKKSLRKKIPFKESVKEELIFYTKFGENVKPVIQRSLSKSRSKSVEDDENCLCEEKQERVYGFIPEFLPQEDKDEN